MPELHQTCSDSTTPRVDFDQWAELARRDPEAFEARRSELIEAAINRLPADRRQRMRCLQWKIDQVRARSGTPMAACIRISEMMWDSLVGPGGLQEALQRLGDDRPGPLPEARVLEFPAAPPA
ncbi:MAG TPA: DUF3135 domain-containing protein [Gammaproteobacteria bacterium]|nr:DUF3135 domain-containing protein [Gammaproteobacteria bacterium]